MAGKLNASAGNDLARGMDNVAAAAAGDIVVLTVKFSHHAATLADLKDALQGKILVDTTVPLVPPKVARVQLPAEGSAAVIAQQILGDEVQVVSAFQNVSASSLVSEHPPECDVLVAGASPDARPGSHRPGRRCRFPCLARGTAGKFRGCRSAYFAADLHEQEIR